MTTTDTARAHVSPSLKRLGTTDPNCPHCAGKGIVLVANMAQPPKRELCPCYRPSANDVEKTEQARQPRPDCVACGGLGKIHVQVPGEFRTASVPCQCWRLA